MNVLVTGASRGIGKAICEVLGKEHKIYATARKEELLKQYENHIICDLAYDDQMISLGDYIEQNNIDILINNAGEYLYSAITDSKLEQIEHIVRVNLSAPMYLISRAVPNMKANRFGRIINIGSISGVVGEAKAGLYSATKSGLIGASKALALELAEFGITVNTVNPGWVDTEMGLTSAAEGDFTQEEVTQCIPQKRFISPYEIAELVKYLISEEAKGITGQSVNLCAGLTCGC